MAIHQLRRSPIPILIAAGIAGTALLWLGLPNALAKIGSQNYLAHGYCFLWDRQLVALHVASDSVIFLSYLAIASTLGLLVYRERKHIPFGKMVIAFGVFIVSCGFTHAMDVVVLWRPLYWLAGDIKLVTALASLATAVALPFVVPRVGALLAEARSSAENQRRFLVASENSPDAFYILESIRDAAGEIEDFRFSFVNAKGARLLSTTPQDLPGKRLCVEFPVNVTDGHFEKYKRVVETGEPLQQDFPIHADHINASWLSYRVDRLNDGVAITTTDISARKSDELELARLANFTRTIVSSSPFATIVTDPSGTITSVNPAAELLLGYSKEALERRETPLVFLDPAEVARRASSLSQELRVPIRAGVEVLTAKPDRGMVDETEWRLRRADGSWCDVQLTVSAMEGPLGEREREGQPALGHILIAYDITERKRMQDHIFHLAHHDALTGLCTRSLFQDRLGVALVKAARAGKRIALLLIDLDGFKQVNDSMGHQSGDLLLVHVAQKLLGAIRESDTVARLGGDEFVVLLEDLNGMQDAEVVAAKLLIGIGEPLKIGFETLFARASVGISTYPEAGVDAASLLHSADVAMYQAKAKGGNWYETFDRGMVWPSEAAKPKDRSVIDAPSGVRAAAVLV